MSFFEIFSETNNLVSRRTSSTPAEWGIFIRINFKLQTMQHVPNPNTAHKTLPRSNQFQVTKLTRTLFFQRKSSTTEKDYSSEWTQTKHSWTLSFSFKECHPLHPMFPNEMEETANKVAIDIIRRVHHRSIP
jgi:hypothetical protein